MKTQIHPAIKAHLLRGSVYFLLLSALCATAFALAQRNGAKHSLTAAKVSSFVATGAISERVGESPRRPFLRKIAPWVIEHTVNGQQAEFFVVLADQADLSGAATLRTKAEKGRYVHDALWNKSQTTQEPILQWLRDRSIEHRSFYIVNAVLVKGSLEIAEALAARPDVARVEGNPHIQNLPQPLPAVE